MKDKDLYNFFKARKGYFEEAPTERLWDRIQNELEAPPLAPEMRKSGSYRKFLLLSGCIGAAFLIWFTLNKPESKGVESPNATEAAPQITVPATSKSAVEGIYPITDTVKTKKAMVLKPIFLVLSGLKDIKCEDVKLLKTVDLQFLTDSVRLDEIKFLPDSISIKPHAFQIETETLRYKTQDIFKSKTEPQQVYDMMLIVTDSLPLKP